MEPTTNPTTNLELVVKSFEELTLEELYHILQARSQIFVVEQTCIYQDIDGKDKISTHIFYKEKDTGSIAAYLRLYWEEGKPGRGKLGRVITVHRGTGLGRILLEQAVDIAKNAMNPKELHIHAQSYAIPFYEKVGFQVSSPEFLEDDIPHVEMILPCS